MEIEDRVPAHPQEKLDILLVRLEYTVEKMESETQAFIEATKQFALDWARREIEMAILSLESESSSENSAFDNEKLNHLKSGLKKLPYQVPDIVKSHLNREELWVHRKAQIQAGISRDYVEFKKDKMLKELTVSIRFILGCSTEILDELNDDGKPEEKGWVKEMGKRKYVCFLRFSDEMTACLKRYFERLEEHFLLNHEVKEEMQRQKDIKDKRYQR